MLKRWDNWIQAKLQKSVIRISNTYVVVRIMNDRNACDRTMQDKGTYVQAFSMYVFMQNDTHTIESNRIK